MRFALAGNPNCGKTTLFNALTGSTAHVGNWPGVTVDRKEGTYKKLSQPITIVDLPGIYSLSPYTPEEVISRNYIIKETPDLIINIVDATNLERNLYLTTQILETGCPVIIALNMMDVVSKSGDSIDAKKLENALGVPVVPISALRSDGVKALMEKAYEAAAKKRSASSSLEKSYMGEQVKKMTALLERNNVAHPLFHAVKLIEGDELVCGELAKHKADIEKIRSEVALPEEVYGDFEAAVADIRYKYITANFQDSVKRARRSGDLTQSDKIDRILTNKWLGIPIFLGFMWLIFHLTFGEFLFGIEGVPTPGTLIVGWVESLIGFLTDAAANGLIAAGASPDGWAYGLIIDGVIAGVFAVIGFLPQILLLFLFLSIMEDSGYMARAAFIMDRMFRGLGLSGKSFMPLLMCFGCMVPGAMATRTLENERERRLTLMLAPFFSCGAKLPIWAMFASALFENNADTMVFGIYLLGIVTAIVAAFLVKKFWLKGESAPFILELPAYHLPRLKNLLLHLWDKMKGFLIRATTIIAGSTVVIWFLANFSFTLQLVEANSAQSILGVLGNIVRPLFIPLGFASGPDGWKAVVAILTGLIAKEMVVSTMGVLYNPGVEGDALEDEGAATAMVATITATFSPLAAVSFMAFNLLSVPCMAAVAAVHGELRSAKKTWSCIGFWILTAWVVSFLIYNIGRLLGIGV